MWSSLPPVTGYDGPLTLKAAFETYFGRHVVYSQHLSTQSSSSSSSSTEMRLPATGAFAVVMYVPLEKRPSSQCLVAANSQTPRSRKPPPWIFSQGTSSSSSSSSSSTTTPTPTPTSTHATTSLTQAVMRHPLWMAMWRQMSDATSAYVFGCCAIVAQFGISEGGLQVLGPALSHGVAPARCIFEASRPRLAPTAAVHAAAGARGGPSSRTCAPTTCATRCNGLSTRDVPRRALMGGRPTSLMLGTSTSGGDEESASAVPPHFVELSWLLRHPNSLARVWPRKRSRFVLEVEQRWHAQASSSPPLPTVSLEMVREVFCFSLSNERLVEAPPNTSAFVRHLQWLLTTLVEQIAALDLRGIALRHVGHVEAHMLLHPHASVDAVVAPVELVLCYTRNILEGLCYAPPPSCAWHPHNHTHHAATATASSCVGTTGDGDVVRSSFWGPPHARVLDGLMAAVGRWLRGDRRIHVRLCSFLDGIRVGSVPWLAGIYTKCHHTSSTTTTTTPAARQRRSLLQQRVWCEMIFFLTQHVLPFVLRRSFYLTWSSKDVHHLIFFPHVVWQQLLRRQREMVLMKKEVSSPSGGMGLRPLSGVAELRERLGHAEASAPPPPPLLYASLRYLPDGAKLRPIAVMRVARRRSLARMSVGLPNPRNLRGRVISALAAHLMMRPSHAPSHLHRTKMRARPTSKTVLRQALRCLVAGLQACERAEGQHPRRCTPLDDYVELRSFAEELRSRRRRRRGSSNDDADDDDDDDDVCVSLVRGDASRCYDRLPQAAVMQLVDQLLPHHHYHLVRFIAVRQQQPHGKRSRDDADADGDGGALLRQTPWSVMLPSNMWLMGCCRDIPRGWIVREILPRSSSSSSSSSCAADVVDGAAVRALLQHHLVNHVVVWQDMLFLQTIGIPQGSPVAMLLCDRLLRAVDQHLSELLSTHVHDASLLLRRVDDVLVLSTSAIAAQRCWGALRHGFPEVGFVSEARKLILHDGSSSPSRQPHNTEHHVGWCGLRIIACGASVEVGVDWPRVRRSLDAILNDLRANNSGDVLRGSHCVLQALCRRVNAATLCARINTTQRVWQTMLELALVWAYHLMQSAHILSLHVPHQRCTPTTTTQLDVVNVLLRSGCRFLCRWLVKQRMELAGLRSSCSLSAMDLRMCVGLAMLRVMMMIVHHHPSSSSSWMMLGRLHRRLQRWMERVPSSSPAQEVFAHVMQQQQQQQQQQHRVDESIAVKAEEAVAMVAWAIDHDG